MILVNEVTLQEHSPISLGANLEMPPTAPAMPQTTHPFAGMSEPQAGWTTFPASSEALSAALQSLGKGMTPPTSGKKGPSAQVQPDASKAPVTTDPSMPTAMPETSKGMGALNELPTSPFAEGPKTPVMPDAPKTSDTPGVPSMPGMTDVKSPTIAAPTDETQSTTAPIMPEAPKDTTTPSNVPMTPDTPKAPVIVDPSKPVVAPEAPTTPIAPEAPKGTDTVIVPNAPTSKETPTAPVTPESPKAPVTPEAPKTPGTPEAPKGTVTPESPKTPGMTDTPKAPSSTQPTMPEATTTPTQPAPVKETTGTVSVLPAEALDEEPLVEQTAPKELPTQNVVLPNVAPVQNVTQPTAVDAVRIAPEISAHVTETMRIAAEAVAETFRVSPELATTGRGEIQIQLKRDVLEGSGVRFEVQGSELKITLAPATQAVAQLLEKHLETFQTHLAERVANWRISVGVTAWDPKPRFGRMERDE